MAIQGRLPLAALAWSDGDGWAGLGGGGIGVPDATGLMVPMVAPGVRVLQDKLFVGLGLGFSTASWEDGDEERSRSGWSLSPTVSYDVIGDTMGALSIGGVLNIAGLGETEVCDAGTCMDANDDASLFGLNLVLGARGKLSPSLAIGAEFGWGLLTGGADGGADVTYTGFIGALLVEGSVGL